MSLEVDRVLAQIRALSAQANGGVHAKPIPTQETQGAASAGFSQLLKQGIDQVNSAQAKANEMATAFERGTPGVELPQVMLEMQKASVSFRALTEVRNRMVSAYQEIMNMPI